MMSQPEDLHEAEMAPIDEGSKASRMTHSPDNLLGFMRLNVLK